VNDFVPVKGTVVKSIAKPWGPSSPKLWIDDLSVITNVYAPAVNLVTLFPPLVSVIVIPGPTVPVNFGAAASDADIGGRVHGRS
jgi:hypothetical protein